MMENFAELLRKLIPDLRLSNPEDELPAHLERLAATSPHLLPDLGFELERNLSTSTREVWQNDQTTIVINKSPFFAIEVIEPDPSNKNTSDQLPAHTISRFVPANLIQQH